jgi:7-carboxy-7-deazaguanine synthase
MKQNTLSLSESFYSVQCEGHTTGYPAYFIRLKGCNLSCGLSTKHMREILKAGAGGTESGSLEGDLVGSGTATWTCDTAPIWLFGSPTTFDTLTQKWEQDGILDWIKTGRIHLIWSGGEPTIPKHQESIINFLDWFHADDKHTQTFNEIETNGTFYIKDELFNWLNQINCSVKLANSGMTEAQRINPDAIKRIMSHSNYWFKFVISNEDDINEIKRDYIFPFNIPWNRVLMMPGLDSREHFHERTEFVLQMAKKHGFIGLTRLHVSAWDKTTGV